MSTAAPTYTDTNLRKGQKHGLDAILIAIAAVFGLAVLAKIGIVLALCGAAMFVLVCITLAKPEIATIAVVFVMYGNLAPVAVRSYNVPRGFAVSFFLLLLVPLAYYVIGRGERLRTDAVLPLMFVYLLIQLASAAFARNSGDSWTMITAFASEGIAVYFLLLNTIRSDRVLRLCLWAMLAVGAILGSVSIVQNRTNTFDREYGGLALTHLSTTQDPARVDLVNMSLDGDKDLRTRVMGTIGDPNFYAQILAVLIPIATFRMWAEKKRWLRWTAALIVIVLCAAIAATYSRGAALAVVGFAAALFAFRYVRKRYIVVPVVIAAIAIALSPDIVTRLSSLNALKDGGVRAADPSVQERSAIYLSGLHIFLDHPVLGVGIGQAKEYLPEYSNYSGHRRLWRKMGAHNMYLEILAETGLLGFGAFCSILWVTVRRLWRARAYWKTRNPEFTLTISGLLFAIMMFLVTGLFLHLAYGRYWWLLVALAGAASSIYKPAEEPKLVVVSPPEWAGVPATFSSARLGLHR